MVKLYEGGAYLVHGTHLVPEKEAEKVAALTEKRQIKRKQEKGQWHTQFWRIITLPEIWKT